MTDAGSLPLHGVGTALVTPFRGAAVDLDALERLALRQIEEGVDFLVPCGTTGESPTLTDAERIQVIERTVDAAGGRVPVVAGTGTNDTPHSIAMTNAARQAGATACLAVAPYYNRPTQEGIYRHFRSMIDEGGLPAVLYHIPSRSGISIDVKTVRRTAEGGGVVGLKETGGVDRVTHLRRETDVPIFSGDDGLTLPMMALGAVGVVSVVSNLEPARTVRWVRAAARGDVEEARKIHDALAPLVEALFLESNPAPIKVALTLRGLLEDGGVRLPLVAPTAATRARLAALV